MPLKDNELVKLRDDIMKMASLVEAAIDSAIKSLLNMDTALAQMVVRNDHFVNALDVQIDEACIVLIALRQPVAGDLRFITTAMKITTDLERMADNAVNIANRVVELPSEIPELALVSIPKMREIALGMLTDAVASFLSGDKGLAMDVITRDQLLDGFNEKLLNELVELMTKDTSLIIPASKLSSISRYIERIGDHATNIAEMVIYMVEGQIIKHMKSSLNQ
ncbi:phosphate signaling complex protein PhoU [Candidatus Magnetominusculus xianensis]|uniref:Phosphate-specific transport system accessory protein PhoU n=1 Tax=Candidatus Magnetominusculus xianensis TaxID=1748249 RepID=A0ABR5SID3_9BACT|nr:phosphate signaling complex protein PhoU [Candidatus Magnetominusculus xianensis]KWT90975.1 PhoU family transcriptional regulator [Candidatus Magnetominusculus xianensis]MBF0403129.1 phosphate signaling complex protein PhoU [Nitrospirota bacterium]